MDISKPETMLGVLNSGGLVVVSCLMYYKQNQIEKEVIEIKDVISEMENSIYEFEKDITKLHRVQESFEKLKTSIDEEFRIMKNTIQYQQDCIEKIANYIDRTKGTDNFELPNNFPRRRNQRRRYDNTGSNDEETNYTPRRNVSRKKQENSDMLIDFDEESEGNVKRRQTSY